MRLGRAPSNERRAPTLRRTRSRSARRASSQTWTIGGGRAGRTAILFRFTSSANTDSPFSRSRIGESSCNVATGNAQAVQTAQPISELLQGVLLWAGPRSIAAMQSPLMAMPDIIVIDGDDMLVTAGIAQLGAAALRNTPSARNSVPNWRANRPNMVWTIRPVRSRFKDRPGR